MLAAQRLEQADREHAVLVQEVGAEAGRKGRSPTRSAPIGGAASGRREVSL